MTTVRTTTITNVLQRPGTLSPITGRKVTIRLNVPGFVTDGTTEKVRTREVTTDATGTWTAVLEVNADIDPAGTYYTVNELGTIWAFVVPYSATPLTLRACLVADPTNPSPLIIGVQDIDIGTVTTGAAGSSAAAAMSGTAPTLTLDLTIPRGNTGAAGAAGATGATGATGPTGPTGPSGTNGVGLPTTVVPAATTYTAAVSEFVEANAGAAGFTVTLPAAPATGAIVGVKKMDATANVVTVAPAGGGTIDGDPNATIVAQWAGAWLEHVGSNAWLVVSVMNASGPTGPVGPTGSTGATGAAGPTGPTGPAGTNGTNGTNGSNGTNGAISLIQDEGSALTVRPTLDFAGAGVTATDDAANNRTLITIPGGGGGSNVPLSGSVVGWYYMSQAAGGATVGASSTTLNLLYYVPIWLEAGTLDRIGQQILSGTPTSAETVRMGLYADNGRGYPGSVVVDGSVDLGTAGIRAVTVSTVITRGLYWTALVRQGTGVTVGLLEYAPGGNSGPGLLAAAMPSFSSNLFDAVHSLTQSGVTGALPATAAPTAGVQKIVPAYVRYGA